MPKATVAALLGEVDAIQPLANRKDFMMECMGSTPRHMTTISGLAIAEGSPAIVELYHDGRMLKAISELIDHDLEAADDPVERHVLNMLHEGGDTHGYHTDDYPIALVMFIESPTCDAGCGQLEFCAAASQSDSQLRSHRAGDAYILRSDQLHHRVQPIHDGCRRTVLNFAYAVEGHPVELGHSASLLYT